MIQHTVCGLGGVFTASRIWRQPQLLLPYTKL